MTPLMYFMLAFFTFEADSIFDPWQQSSSLYSLRWLAKKHNGVIMSRPYVNGSREKLEQWKDGQIVWRNPRYDVIMKEQQDYLEKLCLYWKESLVMIRPDDRMP